jgi:3-methylfumaryl-CoA hydratase
VAWAALPRWTPSSALGPHGQPQRGSFLPPADLPRRMFAGGEVTVHRPLVVGEEVRVESRVTTVDDKTGRRLPPVLVLVLVVVETVIRGAEGEVCVVERQDLLYREAWAQ